MAVEAIRTRWPAHSEDEIEAVGDILRAGLTNMWQGRENSALETEWSSLVGLPHTLTVSNGTVALEAAINVMCSGIQLANRHKFDVIVPARTFVACASAVVRNGMRPVLADISADSLCVTPETLEAARTPNTLGVILVHWAGLVIPRMEEIVAWGMRHGIWLIEDCSHAHGAPVGKQSHIATWSMCVGKIMSTGGEGGLISCLDNNIATALREYRDHGRYQMTGRRDMEAGGSVNYKDFEWTVSDFGGNIRLTEMQAVLGRYQLRGLAQQAARRREIAARYDEVLGWRAMHTPEQRTTHARYLYSVSVAAKRPVMEALNARGIPARWGGCHNIGHEEAFTRRGWVYDCPVADRVGETVFTLPVYPTMSDDDVTRVCQALREVV